MAGMVVSAVTELQPVLVGQTEVAAEIADDASDEGNYFLEKKRA